MKSYILLLLFALLHGVNAVRPPQPLTDILITEWFLRWKPYTTILLYLHRQHIYVSMGLTRDHNTYVLKAIACWRNLSWLKRRLRHLGLFRRGPRAARTTFNQTLRCIQRELCSSGSLLGYRQLWKKLRDIHGVYVKRETVRVLLKLLDPVGINLRRRHRLRRRSYVNKGPDFVWHLDQHDKLKRYGFALHACIDGYSRYLLWMEVSPTNNDPRVILKYYLDAIAARNGCPTLMRADRGTENVLVAAVQMTFRDEHGDAFAGTKAFRYGRSTSNTRIEGWWSFLRRYKTSWFMEVFEDLVDSGDYNPTSTTHKHCLCYCFQPLIERELQDFRQHWNSHTLRTNRLARCPSGIPEDMYNIPELTGTRSYLKSNISAALWLEASVYYASDPPPFYPQTFKLFADTALYDLLG